MKFSKISSTHSFTEEEKENLRRCMEKFNGEIVLLKYFTGIVKHLRPINYKQKPPLLWHIALNF